MSCGGRSARRSTSPLVAAVALAGALAGAGGPAEAGRPGELMVFAAASTTDLVGELAERFEEQTGARVRTSFASSSTLARQIEHGAPADVFVSANVAWMDRLENAGAIETHTRFDWASNRVALVAPADEPLSVKIEPGFDLASIVGDRRIAIADPSHVPAGRYAAAALGSLGVLTDLRPLFVHAPDVRAALALVERGEVAAGFVYATDAAASDRVALVDLFPEGTHPPIVYPVAIARGQDLPLARRFLAFLKGEPGRQALERYGFLSLSSRAAAGGEGS